VPGFVRSTALTGDMLIFRIIDREPGGESVSARTYCQLSPSAPAVDLASSRGIERLPDATSKIAEITSRPPFSSQTQCWCEPEIEVASVGVAVKLGSSTEGSVGLQSCVVTPCAHEDLAVLAVVT